MPAPRYGEEIGIEPGALESFFLLQISLAGSARIETAGLNVDSSTDVGTLLLSSLDVKMVWSDTCRKLLLQISRTFMEQALEGLLDRHVSRLIEFAPAFPIREIQGRIASTVQFWKEDLEQRRHFRSRHRWVANAGEPYPGSVEMPSSHT